MMCCLPGTRVQDVVERYRRVVEGSGKEALVVVHVDRYRELLREIKESGKRCIVSGVLARQGIRDWWLSHALGQNERLRRMG